MLVQFVYGSLNTRGDHCQILEFLSYETYLLVFCVVATGPSRRESARNFVVTLIRSKILMLQNATHGYNNSYSPHSSIIRPSGALLFPLASLFPTALGLSRRRRSFASLFLFALSASSLTLARRIVLVRSLHTRFQ